MLAMAVAVVALAQLDPAEGGLVPTEDAGVAQGRAAETLVIGARAVDVRRVAGSAQVVGQEELERLESNDLNRVLQQVPGAYVREEEGFGNRPNVGFRGVNADRSSKITLMEDGVLIAPSAYSSPQAYFFPALTRMVGLEIFKGPAAIRYGPNTIGGALNLRTREVPVGLQGDLDVAVGNYGYGKAHGVFSFGDERYGLLLEGVRWGSTGFKQLPGGGDTGFSRNEFMLKARAATAPSAPVRTGFELKLAYGDERSNETYLGLTAADFAANPYQRSGVSALDLFTGARTQVQLTNLTTLDEALEVRTTAYRFDFRRTWTRMNGFRRGPAPFDALALERPEDEPYRAVLRGGDSRSLDESIAVLEAVRPHVSQGVQSAARWRVGHEGFSNELEVGLRFHHDEARRVDDLIGYQTVRGALVPDVMGRSPTARRVDFTRAFSAYLQDTFVFGRLLLAPGARLELIDSFSASTLRGTSVSYRNVVPLLGGGAVYAFDVGLSLFGGVHQGFSPVAPGQAADVKPERALNSELGVRYAREGTRAELVGFWSEYENITGECTNSNGCALDELSRQFNGGRARVLGVEALVSRRQPLPALGLTVHGDLAYTFTSARFLTSFRSDNPVWGVVEAGDLLPYIPSHQLSLRARVNRGPFEAALGAMYYGALREAAGQGAEALELPARWMLDASLALELGQARFYLTATNLLNQAQPVSRRPFGLRPQAPMMAQLGFKYAFR